ncbi:MAG: ROK family protein [Opitutaceae bacterium]|jgi:glucokinase|nr:ROK family protein [Opitutaceae bacterium]
MRDDILLGFDIGGTKCAVILGLGAGREAGAPVRIVERVAFPTGTGAGAGAGGPGPVLGKFERISRQLLEWHGMARPDAIGISCGSPLDSRRGIIQRPPNLPGWDNVPVTDRFSKIFNCPVHLQNDANACAFAEWRWGAGQGTRNMVFLTFGTGMGAGLILDGKLYSGTNDNAGEVGHMRMAEDGPEGYGKRGSFEGFCSGGGMVRLSRSLGLEAENAHEVFTAAANGNALAVETVRTTARELGRGLAVLVDILNPERIVIGSIFARQQTALWPVASEVLHTEALASSLSVCEIVPAQLDEQVGDYAALSVATLAFQ